MSTLTDIPLSTLRLLTVLDRRGMPSIRPFVDDLDLLLGYQNPKGLDPDDLLPPLSTRLLPTRAGTPVLLGRCSCGEAGCGSLQARVRREGDDVVWEPTQAPDETLTRAYRFALRAYLDAVDDAASDRVAYRHADPTDDDATDTSGTVPLARTVPEGSGRRVARGIRRALRLYDQVNDTLSMFYVARLDWVSAWPWDSPDVQASVTTRGLQETLTFTAQPDEDEDDFGRRVMKDLDTRRRPR
ncbi:MAG: hypothetical protein U0Q15_00530 [Kineosporiaceae bacterium]